MSDLSNTSYAVLGLLSVQPMSGYDLVRFADRSIAHFWSIPRSGLYRELTRLDELGLVAAEIIVQDTAPTKRIYTPTPTGAMALRDWLDAGDVAREPARDGLLLTFYLSRFGWPGAPGRLLAARRALTEQTLATLDGLTDHLSRDPDTRFGALAARYGALQAEATLRWISEVEQALRATPDPDPEFLPDGTGEDTP